MAVDPGENSNLYVALMRPAETDPNRPLLHRPAQGDTLSYGEVRDRSAAMAQALTHSGLSPGDRLVVQVEKSSDAVALWLACLRTGVIFVPLNTAYTDAEVEAFVEDAETGHLITSPERARGLTMGSNHEGSFCELVERCQDEDRPSLPLFVARPEDPAAMLFTSGTTGPSKGAVLTHRGLRTNGEALAQVWDISSADHLLHSLPVFHVHGLFVALHPLLLKGAEITFLERFTTEGVVEVLPKCTVLMGVPTHYTRLLDYEGFTAEVASPVRLFTSGSAPMTTQVHQRFTERTGRTITERYGMTECGIITSNTPGRSVVGSVGAPLPQMQLRIGAGSVVEVKGPHLLTSYWRRPDATDAAFTSDGWFITGDVGTLDDMGLLTLSGRSSDMIISGGYNIYPKEIEQLLDTDPQILESAVVGAPNEEWGEEIVAFIVLSDETTPELFSPPKLSDLARFKHPRRYRFLAELPRNTMGKVQKGALGKNAARTIEGD